MRAFLPYLIGQNYLLPPDVDEWLSQDHAARFIRQLVTEELDLSEVFQRYEGESNRGAPAYHPTMMMALLIYSYAFGARSSRKIEAATFDDLAVRFITANQHPDHDSIAHFRKRHKDSFHDLFLQSLQLCAEYGLIKLGDIDLYVDGTKMLANASRHQTVSYAKLRKTEQALSDLVASITEEAEAVDAAEDKAAQENGGDPPLDLRDPQKVRERLRAAKERLARTSAARSEMERSAGAEAENAVQEAKVKFDEHEQEHKPGRKPTVPDVEELAQKLCEAKRVNLTDPDSRLMKDGATKACVQAYNCQIVTAGASKVILACDVTSEENDLHQLAPMADLVRDNLKKIGDDQDALYRLGADAGYLTVAGIQDPRLTGFDAYIAPGRDTTAQTNNDALQDAATTKKSGQEINVITAPEALSANLHGSQVGASSLRCQSPPGIVWYTAPPAVPTLAATLREDMRTKINTPEGKEFYSHRSDGVEPVFGETKEARGIRRLLLRGVDNAAAEWNLICFTHNIRKLFRQAHRSKVGSPAPQIKSDPQIKTAQRRTCVSAMGHGTQMAFGMG